MGAQLSQELSLNKLTWGVRGMTNNSNQQAGKNLLKMLCEASNQLKTSVSDKMVWRSMKKRT